VIGVDLAGCEPAADGWGAAGSRGVTGILRRTWEVQWYELYRRQLAEVDVLIRPDVAGCTFADLGDVDGLVERGRAAAEAALPRLRRAVRAWQARQAAVA
jgi:hypothetical protein